MTIADLNAEILEWVRFAKGGDLVGHEFHGNQHTGGIGGGGEPARQSDPGRYQVSADRYKSPNGEEPQNVPQGQAQVTITPTDNTPEGLKSFSEDVLKNITAGKQPVIKPEDYPKMLQAMEGLDSTLQDGVDLTELRIGGTNLMGDEGMGVPRIEMPQIPGDARPEFLADIQKSNGVTMETTTVDPTTLKPWQCEVNGMKIAGMFRSWKESGVPDEQRILVSSDGYVIDGHHTWAAAVGIKFVNSDTSLPIYRLSITGKEAIDLSNQWADAHGYEHQTLSPTKKAILKWIKKMREWEALTTIS